MTRTRRRLVAILIIGMVGLVAVQVIAQVRSRRIQARFDSLDRDQDGQLSVDEFGTLAHLGPSVPDAAGSGPAGWKTHDKNSDQQLSPEEFREWVLAMLARRKQSSGTRSRPHSPRPFVGTMPADAPFTAESLKDAAHFNAETWGISLVVMFDGKVIYEDYPNGGAPDRAFELASGTKSFVGVMACAAIDDGWLAWDEPVSNTLTSWKRDPAKSTLTVAQLLSLTSGLDPNSRTAQKIPGYESAIGNDVLGPPDERFRYGPASFQCFGELMRRKLAAAGHDETPLEYLERRIFRPLGVEYQGWREDSQGNPHLSMGAMMTARNWARFGELVRQGGSWRGQSLFASEDLDRCFEGTKANPAYGMTFWLNQPVSAELRRSVRELRYATDDMTGSSKIPSDVVFAAGAGRQRMYVSRSGRWVVVRQADGIRETMRGNFSGYSDRDFLDRLLKD